MIESSTAQIIQTIGFPIFAFILMYHLVRTTIAENTLAIRELSRLLRERRRQ